MVLKWIIFLVLIIFSSGLYSQNTSSCLRVMFYNVENAFDIYDDKATDDNEFLPQGVRRWNKSRYDAKLKALYKVITAAGEWSPPEIIAFCEVENRKVIEDIIGRTYLTKYNYRIIHEDSPDPRGIDVCLIYNADYVRVISASYWKPSLPGPFTSRTVLHARIIFRTDTFNIIVNHWPSRRGGVLAGMDLRTDIASMVKQKADSIRLAAGAAYIIITGDFNSNPEDPEMAIFNSSASDYVNLSAKGVAQQGTYRYQGRWEMFDQVVVSSSLADSFSASLQIINPGFLLIEDPVYPGKSPFSTYRGFRYQGGFSDHLPVVVTFQPE